MPIVSIAYKNDCFIMAPPCIWDGTIDRIITVPHSTWYPLIICSRRSMGTCRALILVCDKKYVIKGILVSSKIFTHGMYVIYVYISYIFTHQRTHLKHCIMCGTLKIWYSESSGKFTKGFFKQITKHPMNYNFYGIRMGYRTINAYLLLTDNMSVVYPAKCRG